MFRMLVSLLVVAGLAACAKKNEFNACEQSLNLETVIKTLRDLPSDELIREVTQNYVSSRVGEHPSYLPQSIIIQKTKDSYLNDSWLGGQNFVQDCKTQQVHAQGFSWNIATADPSELRIYTDNPANIQIRFKKIAKNMLVMEQTSNSDALRDFRKKTLFRWGKDLPSVEEIEADFILGLLEEGLQLPDEIARALAEQNNGKIKANISDLHLLNDQLLKLLGNF